MYIILPIVLGLFIASQTAINSKLRSYVISPFLTSFISFAIGAVFLCLIVLMNGDVALINFHDLFNIAIWLYSGGILGVIFLTMNVVLFKKIGGIQTAALPIFGQLLMGIMIDQFGLFNTQQQALQFLQIIGLVLVFIGVVFVTDLLFELKKDHQQFSHFMWKCIGILSGMCSSTQAAVNGQLGVTIGSTVVAAMISFIVGTIVLGIIVLATKVPIHYVNLALKVNKKDWWIWTGGLLGAAYVFGLAYFVPKIGTGQLFVLALFGQLLCSVCIDKFGWFGAMQKSVSISKISGLLLMLIGVILVKL